jgi:hypothetical protein
MAGLAQLSRPKGAEMRRRPCMVHAEDRYEVRCCKKEVSITLVSVLDIIPLTIIYVVACVYSK